MQGAGKKNTKFTKFLTGSKSVPPCERPPYFIFSISLFHVMASTLHAVNRSRTNWYFGMIILKHAGSLSYTISSVWDNHLLPSWNKVMGDEILQRLWVVRQGKERGIRVAEREVGGVIHFFIHSFIVYLVKQVKL